MGKLQKLLLIGCVLLIGGIMAFAVVMNKKEAAEFADKGIRTTATVTEKYQRTEKTTRSTESVHSCLHLDVVLPEVGVATGSTCNRGVDQIYDTTKVGDEIRVVYLAKDVMDNPDGGKSLSDVMLEAWADQNLTQF